MDAALEAALQGPRGANPLVGAVVVGPDGRHLVTGYHRGRRHRPRRSRRDRAGDQQPAWTSAAPPWWSRWNPATTVGRTGPCAQAIIDAGYRGRRLRRRRSPRPRSRRRSHPPRRRRQRPQRARRRGRARAEPPLVPGRRRQTALRHPAHRPDPGQPDRRRGRHQPVDLQPGIARRQPRPPRPDRRHPGRARRRSWSTTRGSPPGTPTAKPAGEQPLRAVMGYRGIPDGRRHPRRRRQGPAPAHPRSAGSAGRAVRRGRPARHGGRRLPDPERLPRRRARGRTHRLPGPHPARLRDPGTGGPRHHHPGRRPALGMGRRRPAGRSSSSAGTCGCTCCPALAAERHRQPTPPAPEPAATNTSTDSTPLRARRGHRRRRQLMFTGIIAEQGKVLSVDRNGDISATVRLHAPGSTEGLALGGSIAVNGVCLTATAIDGKDFSVDVMGETLARSTIGELAAGDAVNLERCVPAGGRLDGHVVQGHVDGVGAAAGARGAGQLGPAPLRRARRAGPLHRGEGVHRRRRRLPDRHRRQPGRRTGAVVRSGADPHHAGRHRTGRESHRQPR